MSKKIIKKQNKTLIIRGDKKVSDTLKKIKLFTNIDEFQNIQNISTEDVEEAFDKWSKMIGNVREEDFAKMIIALCEQYTKEELAAMVLSQMITLKFNDFNLASYEILKRKIKMTKEERAAEKRRQHQEVSHIFYNEILKDKKIINNKHDMLILVEHLVNPLITYATRYPVKIKLSNYELSEYTDNIIKNKLKKYIKIID